MRPVRLTVGAQASSAIIPLDWREDNFKVALAVVLSAGAVLTYTVEHTFDDIQDSTVTPTWFDTDGLTALTANDESNFAFPIIACRLTVTAYTSGDATITVIQSGG